MTATAEAPAATVDVEIVVPVHNEERDLEASMRRLHDYLLRKFPFTWLVTIADNASTDRTSAIAAELSAGLESVRAVRLDEKGRGRALRQVWGASTARVVAYMDVDLSTDLAALLPLVAPLLSEHSDVAIGTRLQRSAVVTRGPKREVISRGYNLLLRAALGARFSDAQCGFKASRTECARALLPYVRDTGWFFDTELLVLAERAGLRIAEIPVDWVDDPDSRVDIVATARADLSGILRVARALVTGQIPLDDLRRSIGRGTPAPVRGVTTRLTTQSLRFGLIGAVSTFAYLALYLLLRPGLGAQLANALALPVTALANTAANRRLTFGVRGTGLARHQLQGLLVFAIGLGLTSGSLVLLRALVASPGRLVELSVLVTANLLSAALRFVLLREWVFAPRKETS